MSAELKKKSEAPLPTSIEDDLEIIGVFKGFLQRKEKLWIWQRCPDGEVKRVVHYALVKKIDSFRKLVELRPNNTNGFQFADPKLPLFIYSDKRFVALKSIMRECTKEFISIPLPKKLNAITGEQLQNLELIEKENEKEYEHQRTAPRFQAKTDQLITLKRNISPGPSPIQHYKLYDMSQGGLAFEVSDPAEFVRGDQLTFIALSGKPLPKEIQGEVVSVRQMDDGLFKIGIKFL